MSLELQQASVAIADAPIPYNVASRATHGNPADARAVIAAALIASTIGALFYNLLPLYLGGVADARNLDNSRVGLLGTAFFFGFNVAGFSAVLWVRRWNWRVVCLSVLPLALCTLFASVAAPSYPTLLVATACGGLLFGSLFTVGSVIIGDTTEAARWYGVKTACESIAGSVLLVILPLSLTPRFGFLGTVLGMSCLALLLAPALFFLPATWTKGELSGLAIGAAGGRRTSVAAVGAALSSLLLFFTGNSAIWAFAERIGHQAGYSAAQIGPLLAVTLICGVAGSFAVAAAGDRFGATRLFAAATGLLILGLACLGGIGSFPGYASGNCLCMIGWSAGTPLIMAKIARFDADGRFVALAVPAIGLGAMIGPGVAGWLLEVSTLATVLTASGVTILVSVGALLIADMGARARRGMA